MLQNPLKNTRTIRTDMFKIAVPIAVSGLMNQIQMLIDKAFLGHYSMTLSNGTVLTGTDFLSAVGNVFFPYIVTLAFLWAIPTGTVVLVSQRLGAKEADKARLYAEASVKYHSLVSIAMYFVWLIIAKPVFVLMGVQEPVLSVSLEYIRMMSLGLLTMGFAASMGSVFQGMGVTNPEMKSGIVMSLVNVVLDWIMIFGKFGFPEMGAAGAGLATAIAGFVANAYYVFAAVRAKGTAFIPSFRGILKARLGDYITVLKVGLPTGVEDTLWNFGNLLLAYMLNKLSSDAVGIYSLVIQIELTPVFLYYGIARGVTTLVGKSTGERNIPEAKRIGLVGTTFSVTLCALFSAVFIAAPALVLRIFTNDSGTISKAAPFLVIASITMFPKCVNIISGNGIRGYGDTLWMLITQIFGIVFVVGTCWALAFPAGLGMYGVFIALFLDETLRGIVNTARFYRGETSLFHKALDAAPGAKAA
jgi:multidrug resistance protein, MATE family